MASKTKLYVLALFKLERIRITRTQPGIPVGKKQIAHNCILFVQHYKTNLLFYLSRTLGKTYGKQEMADG